MSGEILPKGPQTRQAMLRRVAGYDRGIDRADRDPRHPIGQVFRRCQGLVDSCLIAAKRAATLQNEADLLVIGCRAGRRLPGSFRYVVRRSARQGGLSLADDGGRAPTTRSGKTSLSVAMTGAMHSSTSSRRTKW